MTNNANAAFLYVIHHARPITNYLILSILPSEYNIFSGMRLLKTICIMIIDMLKDDVYIMPVLLGHHIFTG